MLLDTVGRIRGAVKAVGEVLKMAGQSGRRWEEEEVVVSERVSGEGR